MAFKRRLLLRRLKNAFSGKSGSDFLDFTFELLDDLFCF